MSTKIRRLVVRWVVAFVGALLLVAQAQAADNWEIGKTQYNAICTNCHSANVNQALNGFPAVKPAGESASYLQGLFNTGATGSQMGAPHTNALRTANNATINDTVSNVAAYIRKPNFPSLSVSPASIAFSSTAVGSTAQQTVRLTNGGDAVLNVSSVSISDSTNFSVPPSACSTVAAGSFCEFTLTFQPQGVGAFNGRTLTISHDALGATAVLNVAGSGQGPVALSTNTLSVAAVIGSPTTASVVFTNAASAGVTINTIAFSGTAASDYSRDASSTCSAGSTVASGGNCTLVVRFNPTSAVPSDRPATLTFTHSAFGSPQTVSLQGTATVAPQGLLVASASSIAFADTQLSSSASQSITLRNTGSLVLQLTALTITGANAAEFDRSGSCSTASTLPINADCTLTMTFRPSALGARSATLTVAHNGSNASVPISLSGAGVPVPAPAVGVEPAGGLNFGAQTIGGLFPARTLRLSNSGSAALNIASIAVEGAAFSNVSATPCPATLAAAQSCDIAVRFAPAAAGTAYTGAVRVSSNAAGSPQLVPLSGSGTLAAVAVLTWTPAVTQLDFGNVSAGTVSAAQSATLRNEGPGGVALLVVNSIGQDFPMFAVGSEATDTTACRAGRVLFEGDTCRVDVRFAPGASGARTATVQVASEGSAPPLLTVVGTGLGGPASAMSLSQSALALDNARVGAVSNPAEIAIRSTGAGPLTVTGMTVSGPFTISSKDCPTTPFTLAAGAACTMTVRFAPQSEGAASGALSVTSDAGAAAQSVALSATGEAKADLGGGGCSIAEGASATDPTLWVLVLLAIAALRYRHRQHARERKQARHNR